MWAGESCQDIQHRIIFITKRKGKFGIPTNGLLHVFQLLARIVEQIISRQGNGHRKTAGVFEVTVVSLHLAIMALSKGFSSLLSEPLDRGGELIFMSDSWWSVDGLTMVDTPTYCLVVLGKGLEVTHRNPWRWSSSALTRGKQLLSPGKEVANSK